MTGYDTISGDLFFLHAEIGAAVHFESIEFDKRSFVQKPVDPLAGSEFP